MIRLFPLVLLFGFAAEIASIIWVGQAIGVVMTLLLLVLGVAAGVALFRSTGVDMASALRRRVVTADADRQLGARIVLRVLAGVLLIVPGFFSDVVAGVLLLPPVQSWLASRFQIVQAAGPMDQARPRHREPTIIEAEAFEIEASDDDRPGR